MGFLDPPRSMFHPTTSFGSRIRAFQDFEIWGDNAGPEYHWDDKSRMFLPKFYYRDFVLPLQVCALFAVRSSSGL